MPTVMISSTARDLPDHRRATGDACRALDFSPVMMEDLPALDADAIDASLAMVDDADVYIGIFAHRYGYAPQDAERNPDGVSITELEYNRAVASHKPRLIFVAADDHVPGLVMEPDPAAAQKLAAFKARVMADRVIAYFTSPDHLRARVVEALAQWREQGLRWMPEPLPDPDYLPTTYILPPGSRVVVGRAQYFVGREDLLVQIAGALLHRSEGSASTVIKPAVATGAGGIGKTVLAVEFAHRYGRYFYGVHWINLFGVTRLEDLDAQLRAEIAANGQRMNLPDFPPDDQPRQVQMTLDAWRGSPPRLLILDNAESPQIVRQALRMFPGMRVLVTSRWGEDADWRVIGVEPRALNTLTRLQSITLLRDLAPHLHGAPDEAVNQLAARLGDYPLALYLAGRYLDRMQKRGGGLPIESYLKRLDTEGVAHPAFTQAAQTHDPALANHHLNVAHCLGLSWEYVTDPLAQQLFRACGYLAPNTPIPPEMLLNLAEGNHDALAVALTQLVQYGLLVPHDDDAAADDPAPDTSERLVVHPLLADFARSLDVQENSDPQRLVPVVLALARAAKEANDTGLPAAYVPLRAHVEALAERADAAGLAEAALLWNSLGFHQRVIADYASARQNYERALAIGERVHGAEHPEVATYANNLGRLLHDLGELEAASGYFARALAVFERVLGEDHPNVATLHNNLGEQLRALGDLTRAREHLERGLAIREQAFGPDHPEVAQSLNNLGRLLFDLGDLLTAREYFERALTIFTRVLGGDHPNVATLHNNLGGLLQSLGNLPAAREHLERAIAIDERVYGLDHPIVAIRLSNLGSLLEDLGDLDGARAYFERALRIREGTLPPGHSKIMLIRQKLDMLGSGASASRPTLNHLRFFLLSLPGERAKRTP